VAFRPLHPSRGAQRPSFNLFADYRMSQVEITYFSDVLYDWACVLQAHVDAVREKFGEAVRIEHRPASRA
jgi:hypothetical protein